MKSTEKGRERKRKEGFSKSENSKKRRLEKKAR
jgi:hypothetical protein